MTYTNSEISIIIEGTGTQKVNIYWNYGNYIVIVPIGTENPSSEGWYEKVGNDYILTTDITVTYGKTYYIEKLELSMISFFLQKKRRCLMINQCKVLTLKHTLGLMILKQP